MDFVLRYIALLFVTKKISEFLYKKWDTWSASFTHTRCKAKKEEGNSLFYSPVFSSDDEHLLIQHYCQSLNQESPLSQPRSPAQILISLESEERGELERILADLEEENRWVMLPAVAETSYALKIQTEEGMLKKKKKKENRMSFKTSSFC